jgi:hypothetical protein
MSSINQDLSQPHQCHLPESSRIITVEGALPLEPADIVFIRKPGPDPMGWFIRKQVGDFNWNHVCMVGRTGKTIWTTGAHKLMFYGELLAQQYLSNKAFLIGRLYGLTPLERDNILLATESLKGNMYPTWSLIKLIIKGFEGRSISKLGSQVNEKPKNFFCSQAVAWSFNKAYGLEKPWREGLILNPKAQKEDCTAYTPETLYYHEGLTLIQTHPDSK